MSGSRKREVRARRLPRRRATGLGVSFLVALFLLFSQPSEVRAAVYYLGGTTGDLGEAGASVLPPGDVTLPLQPVAGQYGMTFLSGSPPPREGQPTTWSYDFARHGEIVLGYAFAPADYQQPTRIAAGVRGTFNVLNSGGTFRFDLLDYDAARGRVSAVLGTASMTAANDRATEYHLSFDNPAGTIPRGHRLALLVRVSDPVGPFHRLSFGPEEPYLSFLRAEESPDPRALRTHLSTSPPAPDGDFGWFTSPVVITLSAEDPDFAGALTLYSWSADNPNTVYAGSFAAPGGLSTLHYFSMDPFNNQDAVTGQRFRVDTVIVPPELKEPRGRQEEPAQGSGTIRLTAEASDSISGVNFVSFFFFERQGSGWNPVGSQIGQNQYPFVGTSYQVEWNTLFVSDGLYKVEAQLRDRAGNMSFSQPEYVQVDNVEDGLDSQAGSSESTGSPDATSPASSTSSSIPDTSSTTRGAAAAP